MPAGVLATVPVALPANVTDTFCVAGFTWYDADWLVVSPSLFVAVHATVWSPTVDVSTGPQDAEKIPDSASVAFGLALAAAFCTTGFGLTEGASAGGVVSSGTESSEKFNTRPVFPHPL